ncbi:MAG TPA: nitroreductase/quinone reductase family protein [Actinomycetota bacterium]|nr:nitroreductase/quinone reductase family protein [Actinomycetota bacterium]
MGAGRHAAGRQGSPVAAFHAERGRLFPRFVEMYKGYAGYEQKTSRQIPLVLLTPDSRPNMA